ncbi:MAG: YigZ family protein [Candidatus Pacebacteria bacterium]|nr:YigZ family protein [Candidatus Paceibacterota bacterium]
MSKTQAMDLGGIEPQQDFIHYEKIISDRRSVYSVSMGRVHKQEDIKNFLKKTKKLKNHHKATHHSWAVRISNDGAVYESKNDDGETGAGQIILRVLQNNNMVNIVICVTRWYGGIKLESDRFKHVQDAAVYILNSEKGA